MGSLDRAGDVVTSGGQREPPYAGNGGIGTSVAVTGHQCVPCIQRNIHARAERPPQIGRNHRLSERSYVESRIENIRIDDSVAAVLLPAKIHKKGYAPGHNGSTEVAAIEPRLKG